MNDPAPSGLGPAGRIARMFIDSKLTPLVVITSVLLGLFAVIVLPREEEPQIRVPMVDVMVAMPGFSAKEVEERATRPMEKLLWEVPGVEYVYSTSRPGESLVIVRFKVGSDVEQSLVRLNQKLAANHDIIPPGVGQPLIKPKSIDDVPILALTFHSERYDHLMLRRIAAQVDDELKQVPLVAETTLIGGARREIRILLDPTKLAARNLSPAGLVPMLRQANRQYRSGGLITGNQEIIVETGAFLANAEDVGNVVVGVFGGKPVYLRQVATIEDGAEEASQYVLFGDATGEEPAVTLSLAKRPGANAITVADEVLRKLETLKGRIIPEDVTVSVTRHYGQTAAEKSNELLFHMGIAVLSVSLLIMFTLGWRESIIVAVAIPSTLALTLLVFYLYGFTLNRITLFALIFSIGILVDDAIVVVENIVRHFHLPESRGRSFSDVAIGAVGEVGNPTILATFAVIFAVVPMAFVGGLMGPYMRPIPIGASAAMSFSLIIAFVVTPWAAVRVLRWRQPKNPVALRDEPATIHGHPEDFFTRLYRRVMGPMIHTRLWRGVFLGGITLLLLASMATVGIGWVKVKMLPFDNKSEFQIILNLPEGSSLERTTQAAREIAAAVRSEPEVTDYQVYAGISSPFNFNGLVRHYFMRRGANIADIQVNLKPKHERDAQSHDIAKRIRPQVAEIAKKFNARVAIAEVPPGPPVLQTLVAEIYGPSETARHAMALEVRRIFNETPGVVDVDWYLEADQPRDLLVIDKEKAALSGISAETISQTLRIAVAGEAVDLLHVPGDREDVDLVLQLPRSMRVTTEELLALRVRAGDGNALPEPLAAGDLSPLVPLRELVTVKRTITDKSIYHKNLLPVTYVIGDVAGVIESPVYAIFQMNKKIRELDSRNFGGSGAELKIHNSQMPFTDDEPSMKWDGEWQITLEVFRDLGLAFAACLVLIYVLMVGWFRSFLTPAIVMVAIPFSLVGILPAHGLMGAFFSATSMIGFMAGAGIVVRNSIILVDFIELRLREGMPLDEAVIDAGAVRFRPMLLTALAVIVGAGVILADPIFQGLAIALMAGEVASLLISRMAVPVLYYMANHAKSG
ncbi:MAG: efflux RND transporter permease subunit [Akkermansiaceae bacterium]|nr:efflux RND transporter permease subunit [Akkermansiaceae bacterium]MCF7732701.1 efflux RND transporter permease subunit [Akkermansiaceae bacterium]